MRNFSYGWNVVFWLLCVLCVVCVVIGIVQLLFLAGITITTPDGVILTQVEFVDGELVPVMKTVKAKGTETTKKQVFERLYKANSGLKRHFSSDKDD